MDKIPHESPWLEDSATQHEDAVLKTMMHYFADELLDLLLNKVKNNLPISKNELVLLTLCPLMAGQRTQKERIKTAYTITREAAEINPEEIRKIEAVIYAMADKFLESMDLEEIMEEISMTRIGQMLVKEGTEQAKLNDARNLIDILDENIIAERIGLPLETVQDLKREYLASKKK